ncbi:efflux transporter outer membrane subunit [Metapseudomonas resinovorans]|nr:efflux transporter outer membrane subunit [Pseudomonas resinovorans]
MTTRLTLLSFCIALAGCGSPLEKPAGQLEPPAAWQGPRMAHGTVIDSQWWRSFGSAELGQLVEQARVANQDLASALARVRQAEASARIAGAALLPSLNANLDANRQGLMSGDGFSQIDASDEDSRIDFFSAALNASYEVDFWGANAAARDAALQRLRASEADRATLELTISAGVASTYIQALALARQLDIGRQNLANAEQVLELVQSRQGAGAATRLELAQQRSLVAAQQRQLPLLAQQQREALIALALLLGQPVQQLQLHGRLEDLGNPAIAAGLPSDLLTRRPDIAAAEAQLVAADGDLKVARAAMLPKLTLTASLATGADRFHDTLRNPYYNLAAGLAAPIFSGGRLSAERDRSQARQDELLGSYNTAILNALADVEKALNSADGLDQQRRWQTEEVEQARLAFDLSETRYQAGAETLLTVLETQRTLFQAQDQQVQLQQARLQASVSLYRALGGGWKP